MPKPDPQSNPQSYFQSQSLIPNPNHQFLIPIPNPNPNPNPQSQIPISNPNTNPNPQPPILDMACYKVEMAKKLIFKELLLEEWEFLECWNIEKIS